MMIPKGKLISIGGNEDKGTEPEPLFTQKNNLNFFELQILSRIMHECGGHDAHIEVITSASSIPEEVGQNYLDAFGKLHCTNVRIMDIRNREDAQNPEMIERIRNCDGVMFSGGNQLRLSSIFGGTQFLEIITERYFHEDGFVIAGTSAGAMAMSNTMIYQGSSSEALLKGEVKITTGLAFMRDVIIDSHFVKRGRFRTPDSGCGSQPILHRDRAGRGHRRTGHRRPLHGSDRIGPGHHHRRTPHPSHQHCRPEGRLPISIENIIVHVLAKGNCFDLKERKFYVEGVTQNK